MIFVLPFLWLALWAALSVVACALLGLAPAAALRTGSIVFVLGGIVLPLLAWLIWHAQRRRHGRQ
ncbi:MAG TPA: hypothetical protein VFM15_00205 [Gammaproteobacteria bacterium]|nr:hypothetical protein [Gammaproteobacteria bacterium]